MWFLTDSLIVSNMKRFAAILLLVGDEGIEQIQLYNITTFGKFKVSEFNKNVEISIIDSNYYNNYNYYNN